MREDQGREDDRGLDAFLHRLLWAAAVAIVSVLLVVVIVKGIDIILVVFGGILFAIFLRALSDPIARRSRLSPRLSFAIVVLILFGGLGLGLWQLGPRVSEQYDEFSERLPEMIHQLHSRLSQYGWGRQVLETLDSNGNGGQAALTITGRIVQFTTRIVFYMLGALFIALFLGANPELYVNGFVKLVAVRHREATEDVIRVLGRTLRWWLVGRALAMSLVGVSTAVMLLLVGGRLAILVGLIVALLTFVPYLGALVGTLPVVFSGILAGTETVILAVILYAIIQNLEGYLLDPLIQQRVVRLPAAITLGSQLLLGLVIGPLGIVFATPLAAVGMVISKEVYVSRILEGEERKR